MKKNSPRANTPQGNTNANNANNLNKDSTNNPNNNSNKDNTTDSNSTKPQQQNGASKPGESGSEKNGSKDFNGFKFSSKSDPFELLETFAMYKLFSEMSHRLFKDVDDDEMLINLAKIISSFNLPPKNKMNTSPMNSFRKQNNGSAGEQGQQEGEREKEKASAKKPKTPTPQSSQESEEKKKPNSDFVFSETIR